VLVDARADDFNIDVSKLKRAITLKTKVIMPVDMGGMPCDYGAINNLVNDAEIKKIFKPDTAIQQQLGRILVLADAAHSFGADYKKNRSGSLTDVSVFSFHAVKNLTTAEGGAVCLNFDLPFNNEEIYKSLCIKSLHGQNKDALAKTQKGNWEYDIVEAGYKWNMPDILAAIGLVELARYDADTLKQRKEICELYQKLFHAYDWAELPLLHDANRNSSYHLYMLRIKNITEAQRNSIVQKIFDHDVSVNVHFKPLPLLSFYKNLGYNIKDYPVAFDNYSREISLPIHLQLTLMDVKTVAMAVAESVEEVIGVS
jgi:dTDP-4-amino-4,6-dideoxygalactose transaminase